MCFMIETFDGIQTVLTFGNSQSIQLGRAEFDFGGAVYRFLRRLVGFVVFDDFKVDQQVIFTIQIDGLK